MHQFTDRIAHTMTFVTPVVEHRVEQDIAQWVHHNTIYIFSIKLSFLSIKQDRSKLHKQIRKSN